MIVLLDNYDSFTYNLYQYLCEITNDEVQVFRNDAITSETILKKEPSGIVISPGPGRPEEAGIAIDLIQKATGKIPILGVCLGFQSICSAFGGKIVQASRICHGVIDSISHDGMGLFRSLPKQLQVTRYHSLALDPETLPKEFDVTSQSPDGTIMGVRHRDAIVEGVQFHPESVATDAGKKIIKNFLRYKRYFNGYQRILDRLTTQQDLTKEEARDFMDEFTEGDLSDSAAAGILIGLNAKGITPTEIAGCAEALKEKKNLFKTKRPALDIVGTGGDGAHTFNISSFAALIAASAGVSVAKHGNRAVSSLSGSADFYRALGVPVDIPPEKNESIYEKNAFAFLFAPLYHGAMRHATGVRRDLGVRTIMNCLGPLVNPAEAPFQVIGAYDRELAIMMGEAALLLGAERVMAVHSKDGLDEISLCAPTWITEMTRNGEHKEYVIEPEQFGMQRVSVEKLKGGDATDNAIIARKILDAPTSAESYPAIREASILNAAAGVLISKNTGDWEKAIALAREALESGKTAALVAKLNTA